MLNKATGLPALVGLGAWRGWWRSGCRSLCQTLHLEFLGHCQERIELLLCNVHLPVVHEVQNRGEIGEPHALEIEKRVGVLVASEDRSEEGRAGGEYHFVCLDLLVVARQSDIKEVFVLSDFTKG